PIWIVPKKLNSQGERTWRIVIDYRNLNNITVGETYPIPQISEILDQLGNSRYFSTLDLTSGFHQILIDPLDAPKTAFSVPQGHFQFNRMPFGLKNAPTTFQKLMNNCLSGLQGNRCFVYLDDIVIYSYDLKSHINNLSKVFERIRNYNLKLQPEKCAFLRKEVGYLGHIINEEGVKPNPDKIQAVAKFPTPKSPKDIKSFLGLVSYYRRFIPDFSKLA
ncbi:RNA-directed DNA polymerase, partial [Pseudomonas aeruginosa]